MRWLLSMFVVLIPLSATPVTLIQTAGGGGGGSACATPTNFQSSAAHLYFWQDNDWATNTIPDDEAGSQTLETSANLDESTDLSNASMPSGMPSGGAYYKLLMDGSTETAATSADTVGFVVSTGDGPYTVCQWTYHVSAFGGNDLWDLWDNLSGFEAPNSLAFITDGSLTYQTSISHSLSSSTGLTSTGTWQHTCTTTSGGGSASKAIYLDGTSVASTTGVNAYAGAGTANDHIMNISTEVYVHAWGIWHSEMSAADVKTMACCGINGEVTDKTARGTLLGIDCSGE